MARGTTFRVFVHLDYVDDLMFYHQPSDELRAAGRQHFREFFWQYGKSDGDIEDDDLLLPPRHCRDGSEIRRRRREDDDDDRDRRRPQTRELLQRVSRWIDGRGRAKDRAQERGQGNGWYPGEPSRYRSRTNTTNSPPPPIDRKKSNTDALMKDCEGQSNLCDLFDDDNVGAQLN